MAWHLLNAALCEALYPALHFAEIVLRNRIDWTLRVHARDDAWFEGSIPLAPMQRDRAARARRGLSERRKGVSADQVVAALPFGFWTAFFNPFHAQTGIGHLLAKRVFDAAPRRDRGLQALNHRWTGIRELRNRVFHHERIIDRGDLAKEHSRLTDTIRWMSADVGMLLEGDRFLPVDAAGVAPWSALVERFGP